MGDHDQPKAGKPIDNKMSGRGLRHEPNYLAPKTLPGDNREKDSKGTASDLDQSEIKPRYPEGSADTED